MNKRKIKLTKAVYLRPGLKLSDVLINSILYLYLYRVNMELMFCLRSVKPSITVTSNRISRSKSSTSL